MSELMERLAAEIKADPDGQYANKSPEQIADIINNGWTSSRQVPVKVPRLDAWDDPVMDDLGRPVMDKTERTEKTRHDAPIFRVIAGIEDAPNIVTVDQVREAM